VADLLTTQTLARWTQNDPDEVAVDPFATDLIQKLSDLICFIGGHPEWSLEVGVDQAPVDVQMVMLQVAKRSYENPEQVLQDGAIGPIGGDRYADQHALFMDFTDAERATIAKYNPDGDPTPQDGAGQIFVVPTTRGDDDILIAPTLYVGDDQQVNLETSADPREWKIPLFNPGDPGDPNNYDDEE
jgi:hypothetical protein